MSVTGIVHPQRVLTNAGCKTGDVLVLTKPLGTGFVTTAHKRGSCPDDAFQAAVLSMTPLNDAAMKAMVEVGVSACTDITGFGLAGHAYGMANRRNVTMHLMLA